MSTQGKAQRSGWPVWRTCSTESMGEVAQSKGGWVS